MEIRDIESAVEGILFASGEPVPIARIADVLEIDAELVADISLRLMDYYGYERRGIRLVRLEDSLQLCSAPELAEVIRRALETRKQPRLSQPALEALAIIAYYQPATRVYVEKIRGVDSSYTIGLLQERGLIEPCGKLDVPGRPTLFRTTKNFLRSFGLTTLEDLPELPEIQPDSDGEQLKLRAAINALTGDDSNDDNGAGQD